MNVYVVIGKSDGTTFGPFSSEESAIEWAKTLYWHRGWYTRAVHPPLTLPTTHVKYIS